MKIVLGTNIAETAVTIDDIVYIVNSRPKTTYTHGPRT